MVKKTLYKIKGNPEDITSILRQGKRLTPKEKGNMINMIFNALALSGIIYIPGLGTLCISQGREHKLMLLDHAKNEMFYDKILTHQKINNWLRSENPENKGVENGNKEQPTYIN
jgi:hypothetical protein